MVFVQTFIYTANDANYSNYLKNAFCKCLRSRHCERTGENHYTNTCANSSYK